MHFITWFSTTGHENNNLFNGEPCLCISAKSTLEMQSRCIQPISWLLSMWVKGQRLMRMSAPLDYCRNLQGHHDAIVKRFMSGVVFRIAILSVVLILHDLGSNKIANGCIFCSCCLIIIIIILNACVVCSSQEGGVLWCRSARRS